MTADTTGLRDTLAAHFVMWHELPKVNATWAIGRPAGEWRCACGLKFGFSDTALDHVAEMLAARPDPTPDPRCGDWPAPCNHDTGSCPAESDAGDVDALTKAYRAAVECVTGRCEHEYDHECASDWLANLRAEVARTAAKKAGERERTADEEARAEWGVRIEALALLLAERANTELRGQAAWVARSTAADLRALLTADHTKALVAVKREAAREALREAARDVFDTALPADCARYLEARADQLGGAS